MTMNEEDRERTSQDADLDARLPVLDVDREEHPVVEPLLSDAPALVQAIRPVVDVWPSK